MGREWFWSRRIAKEERERPGCMPGILHFLDLHHLLFTGGCRTPAGACSPTPEHHHDHHVSSLICKGVEAPRNSLELEDPGPAAAAAVREEYYGIPVSLDPE
ncbi:hypothetical protein AXF42_Ash006020 [Apostasia shenzhenica]|uniref:Uncharacterized protein n=1 Tax=Apostasia shenzhenica TaxID=1088818 RepID=A0A2I0B009_9ASPA|nr:hypothetical protein AXF42_Ash006020 [Apostasia shenzhenica]